jgi:SpoVK/Ycf46/Vps4 family AAA+-type ATPase
MIKVMYTMAKQETIAASSLSKIYQFSAGPFSIRNEWNSISGVEPGVTLPLVRARYSNPILDQSLDLHCRVAKTGPSYKYYGWVFDGTIAPGKDIALPDAPQFFSEYEKSLGEHGLELVRGLFTNLRYVHNANRVVSVVGFNGKEIMLNNNSSFFSTTSRRKGLEETIVVPTVTDVKNDEGGIYGYFRDTLRINFLAVACLAKMLTGQEVEPIDMLLSRGNTYLYDEASAAAHTASERIVLTAEVTGKARKETVTPVELPVVDGVTLEDIGGLEDVRDQLKDVVASFKHPEVMARWGAERPQGILLYGPPGTGKTMLAEALANEIGGELWEIRATDITDKWLGNTEKNMQAIFDRAKTITTPTVMLWDEFDSIMPGSDDPGSAGAARQAVLGIFKKETARLRDTSPNIILVGTTNNPDSIDDAMIRAGRFDLKLYIPLPDEQARVKIFANKISSAVVSEETDANPIFSSELDIGALARMTNGWSGADITECLRRLTFHKAINEARTGVVQPPVTQEEMVAAIKNFATNTN